MAITRYPQLQSGFLGRSDAGLNKVDPVAPSPTGSLLYRAPIRTQDAFFYSRPLEVLFNEMIQDPVVTHGLDFQQRYLHLVGILFDKQSFLSFISLQDKNPGLSSQHAKFLVETLRLVSGQIKQRSISVHTWASILSKSSIQGNYVFRSADVIAEALGTGSKDFRSLDEFIVSWIRTAGWSDMAYGMQVIFGRRTVGEISGYPR